MNPVIIVGVNGQDGTLLKNLLERDNTPYVGLDIDHVCASGVRWNKKVDIGDCKGICSLLNEIKPSEIYYLAAFHHSSQDPQKEVGEVVNKSYEVNVMGYKNFLEAVRTTSPKSKIFYAASSMIFSEATTEEQTEETPYSPNHIYGVTKLNGLLLSKLYREQHGVFASCGILYNHESHFRQEKYVTMKIIQGALDIAKGNKGELLLGDLTSEVDWGYAPDYVKAMRMIMSLEKPDNFIISTGIKHSVQDFVKVTFEHLGLPWEKYAKQDTSIKLRKRMPMVGNNKKLKDATGWEPSVSFEDMIKLIIDERKKMI